MSDAVVDDSAGAPATVTAATPARAPRPGVLVTCDWLREGARSALFLAPRWERLACAANQSEFLPVSTSGWGECECQRSCSLSTSNARWAAPSV